MKEITRERNMTYISQSHGSVVRCGLCLKLDLYCRVVSAPSLTYLSVQHRQQSLHRRRLDAEQQAVIRQHRFTVFLSLRLSACLCVSVSAPPIALSLPLSLCLCVRACGQLH